VFVQEVWLEAHWTKMRAAAAARLPPAFRAARAGRDVLLDEADFEEAGSARA
jgi:hypothetical protein